MADTKRQQVVTAVLARMADITVANGYETDIGQNVTEWLLPSVADEETQVMSVEDPDEETTQMLTSIQEHLLTITVNVGVRGAAARATIRKMIGDIVKAIGVDRQWGGLALDTLDSKSRVQFEQTEKIIGTVEYTFQIKYRTGSWNPFT